MNMVKILLILFSLTIGILFLYADPENIYNRLLFFVLISLVVGVGLLEYNKIYRKHRSMCICDYLFIFAIVVSGITSVLFSFFFSTEYPIATTVLFIVSMISVVSYACYYNRKVNGK